MLGEPYLSFLLGSAITLVSAIVTIILSHKLAERREIRKIKMEEEKKAIQEIYSPLSFFLDKNSYFFAKILALKGMLDETKGIKEVEVNIKIFLMIVFRDVYKYANNLEKLLIKNLGIIKPKELYLDLLLYQSYLGMLATYCYSLQLKEMKIDVLKEILNSFIPILRILEEATLHLKKTALVRTMSLKKYKYKAFFTENVISDIDKKIELLHIKIFDSKITEWDELFNKDFKDQ